MKKNTTNTIRWNSLIAKKRRTRIGAALVAWMLLLSTVGNSYIRLTGFAAEDVTAEETVVEAAAEETAPVEEPAAPAEVTEPAEVPAEEPAAPAAEPAPAASSDIGGLDELLKNVFGN